VATRSSSKANGAVAIEPSRDVPMKIQVGDDWGYVLLRLSRDGARPLSRVSRQPAGSQQPSSCCRALLSAGARCSVAQSSNCGPSCRQHWDQEGWTLCTQRYVSPDATHPFTHTCPRYTQAWLDMPVLWHVLSLVASGTLLQLPPRIRWQLILNCKRYSTSAS